MFRRSLFSLVFPLALIACQGSVDTVPSTLDTGLPAQWQAHGNEPFWGVRLQDGQLRWNDPEHPEGKTFAAQVQAIEGGARWSGRLDGQPAVITVTQGQCSDGMSDDTYPMTVRWEWGGRDLHGCARPLP